MAEEKRNITIDCNATGQPQPSITWSKAYGSLPKEKAAVKNGALTIYVAKNYSVKFVASRWTSHDYQYRSDCEGH